MKQNKAGTAGDLVIVFDQKDNKFLALGLYDPDSPIRIKVLSLENGIKINEQWLTDKLQEAYSKRENLLQTNPNAYRLCFGENDGLPALICDVYAQVAVLKIYSRIWLPLLDEIKAAIVSVTDCEALVLRFSRLVHRENTFSDLTDGQVIYGSLDSEEIQFVEHGVRFNANVIKGHKTGFFLDLSLIHI